MLLDSTACIDFNLKLFLFQTVDMCALTYRKPDSFKKYIPEYISKWYSMTNFGD